MRELTKKERFNDKVLSRFNLYNSIFSTLPYESIANTGVMLPLFEAICVKGYNNNKNPSEIVEEFFDVYMTDSNNTDQIDQSKSIEDNSFGTQSSDSEDLDEDIPF